MYLKTWVKQQKVDIFPAFFYIFQLSFNIFSISVISCFFKDDNLLEPQKKVTEGTHAVVK
jgi:hypothetical protein